MRILAIAYACEPDVGSEPGAGWAWSRMLARLGETWVVTRENNRPAIEASLPSLPPSDRPRFIYLDLPPWARSWKRGQRGVRLYYLIWQFYALRHIRGLQRVDRFDVIWHLTLANAWLGSVGASLGRPFIYGPVGGGGGSYFDPRIVGAKGMVYEVGRTLAASTGRYLNPLARLGWRRAALILAQNEDTVRWLPARHRTRVKVFPNVAVDIQPQPRNHDERRCVALFAGRLLHWKGGSLAVRAMQELPDWQLVICGTGPDESRLRRLAQKLGVVDRVTFRGWVPRQELLEFMRKEAGVLLLPSIHDQAGWIVGEALTLGLPAVCLDRGGPPTLGATCAALDGPSRTARSLAAAVDGVAPGQLPHWDIETRFEQLSDLLRDSGLRHVSAT
jgi:glycosyltransferase involved in cell wall biosynthesis